MEEEFTPQQSFDLINRILENRRITYEQRGYDILIWGIGVMVAGIGQYILIQTQWAKYSGLIWAFTMIPLFFYSLIKGYTSRKTYVKKGGNGDVWNVAGMTWLIAGVMSMLTGFVFREHFGSTFTTVMYLPLCVAALTTAVSLRRKFFVYLVILAVIVSYISIYIPFNYHSLIAAAIAFLLFFIPGLVLRRDNNKRQDV